jgi:SNF2 family DNA or RNA helicase
VAQLPGVAGATPKPIVAASASLPTKPQRMPTLKAGFKPTDIQKQFMSFIEKNQGVGIAAHGVGTGKTAASIMAALNLRAKGKAGKALVIVPAGLRTNFAEQGVKKFTNATVGIIGTRDEIASHPDMDVAKMGDKDFYVVSYDMFKQDPKAYLKATGADTLIADEMHRMKDPQTQLSKTISSIRPDIKNFIGLTASPAMNDPFEAVSLINAISKKKITPAQFQKEFYERQADGIGDWFFGLFGHEKHGPVVGFQNKPELGRFIGASYHFAEPKMKDLPRKKVDVVKVPMSPEQTNLYKAILDKKLTAVEKKILENAEMVPETILQKIVNKTMAARQLSNNIGYPAATINVEQTPKVISMMVDATKELKKNPKGQILMYSNFIDEGTNVLEAALQKAKIPYARFTGEDPKTARDKAVSDYNAGKVKVMLISGAGSEGLNLPNTTMVQMMDGNYNPERITQTEGRGIRRGGLSYLPQEKRVVNVKRYVAVPADDSMSVDEKIYDIAAKKAAFIRQFKQIALTYQKKRETVKKAPKKEVKKNHA